MHILIIGNGFDLAHGLPTRYSDFMKQIQIGSDFHNFVVNDSGFNKKIFNRVKDSIVLKHLKRELQKNEGWIDFENEIREIIDGMCELPSLLKRKTYIQNKEVVSNFVLEGERINEVAPFIYRILLHHKEIKYQWTLDELRKLEKNVHRQIQDFIDLFKEYIVWIIQTKMDSLSQISIFSKMTVDCLLSFNYTPTFLKLYDIKEKNICHVHGEISENGNNGIVMGVGSDFYDEHKHDRYIEFFKFYQCYKHSTNKNYLDWIDRLKNGHISWDTTFESSGKDNSFISIFGHSLDPTDRNILKPFLDLKDIPVYIYYLNEMNRFELEKNLLKILGKELFSTYLAEKNPKIQFKKI